MSTQPIKTNISGYAVELDLSGETTQCFISKGKFSSSLECLMGNGTLDNSDETIDVPIPVINDIEMWALENGY